MDINYIIDSLESIQSELIVEKMICSRDGAFTATSEIDAELTRIGVALDVLKEFLE